jgi:PAS domain S-box-containing protein
MPDDQRAPVEAAPPWWTRWFVRKIGTASFARSPIFFFITVFLLTQSPLSAEGPWILDETGERTKFVSLRIADVLTSLFVLLGLGVGILLIYRNLAKRHETERQLRETIERLELALTSSGAGIWSWNVVDNSIQADEFMHQMFGLSNGEFPNRFKDFLNALHTDDRARVSQELTQALDDNTTFDVQFRVIFPDGNLHLLRSRGQGYRDKSGNALRLLGATADITTQKREEEDRHLTESRLNLALDASQMGAWDLDLVHDRAWRSLRHDRVFGYQTLLAEWGFEIFLKHVLPEDLEDVKKNFAAAFETDQFKLDCRVRWPDQSIHWIGAQGHVYRNEKGEPIRMMGLVTNIDERKQLEERFRTAVEAAPVAMAIVNAAGAFSLLNCQMEEMFGYERNELIGQQVEMLLPERFRVGHPAHRANYFASPITMTVGMEQKLYALRKDGSEFPVRVGLSPLVTTKGQEVICGITDMTDQVATLTAMREAKEAAESANLAKSSFLANMSHEIRTPMNGIIGMAQLLAQTELRSHQRDYLATIDESAHILLRLLNDILDFSKIEAGRLELECVDFHLSECVARASQMLVLRAAEKGLELACRVAPEIPDHLRGDPGRIQQVLVNLLGNAVKFTEAGEIYVNVNAESINHDKVRLHFSVKDTGIGIPKDKQDAIFRPFEQAESSTTRRFGGTGLGLTITRQLVEMMRGRIWIESDQGSGSTFHFTAEFGVSAVQRTHTSAELNSLRDLPVLVVDDNLTNRRVLSELLQFWQMRPVLANSAAAARQSLQQAAEAQHPIRLILLDHHMPGEDGFEFAKSLLGAPKVESCPIIMISSESSPLDAERCQKYGIDRFMSKPVIASELLNEVLRQFGSYAACQPVETATLSTPKTEPRRVLLVDDNEINRRVALGLLRSRGHQVVMAENGQEAFDQYARQQFDLILMDMQMPVMDGYQATTLIRQRELDTAEHIPIVAMTAEALKGDRERCLAAGMDDYITKPIDPAELYRAVERFPAGCLTTDAPNAAENRPLETAPFTPKKETSTPVVPELVGSETATGQMQSAVNWEVARERFAGGPAVLAEFIELAKTEIQSQLLDIRRSIAQRDSKLLRRAAHTMKSSVAYFGAQRLVQAALALEMLGRDDSFAGVNELLANLEQEFAPVLAALETGPT